MSRTIAILLGFCVLCGAPMSSQAQKETTIADVVPQRGDPAIYGQPPLGYKAIINRWLETKLADPASAVIEWLGPPTPGEYRTEKGERFVGYLVDFKVNARNQFGAYTGKQKYRVVILNGAVMWGGHPRS